jgi:hypothetical protein
MENKRANGYITEKILNTFLAGCIPIYYGTTEILNIFNKKATLSSVFSCHYLRHLSSELRVATNFII